MNRKTLVMVLVVLLALAAMVAVVPWAQIVGTVLQYLQGQQRVFHDAMATDMQQLKATGGWLPAFSLILIGFFYGIFHAIGPGHGKVVVTSYMLANKQSLRRGLVIVLASSLLQGLVAIVLVLALFYILGLARAEAERAAAMLEAVSFGLIALVGIALLRRGAREAWQLRASAGQHGHTHTCDLPHEHSQNCGHKHLPTPQEVERVQGIGPLLLLIVSIGIRPCSGAILLLLFACLVGTVGAGIAATMAMALGTAITTAALAIAAVQSKAFVLRLLKSSDRALAIAHAGLGIVGGAFILLLGLMFLVADLQGLSAPQAAYAPPYMRQSK